MERQLKLFFDKHMCNNNRKSLKSGNAKLPPNVLQARIQRMISCRGLQLDVSFRPPVELKEFKIQQATTTRQSSHNNKNTVLWVVTYQEKIGVSLVRKLHTEIGQKVTDLCIISCFPISSMAKKMLDSLSVHCTIFRMYDLQKCIIDHFHVPPHVKLGPTEKKRFLARYNPKHVPKIRTQDVIVQYYGWLVGDIIQITRRLEETQEPTTYYRIVTDKT